MIRRFARSSRLVLTVATIGLAQILGAIGLVVLIRLGADAASSATSTRRSARASSSGPYPVRGDHLLMLGVAPVVLAGLGWFLLKTDAGRAVRAAAENQDRALLLGVPVRRLQTIVWALAGGLATITFITQAPFTGVIPDPGALTGATAILPGLAVAVIARFQSLPTALWAGIGLGIAEWTIRWNVHAASIFDVAFLVVILAALLLRRERTTPRRDGRVAAGTAPACSSRSPRRCAACPRCGGPVRGVAGRRRRRARLSSRWSLTPSTRRRRSASPLVAGLIAVSLVVLTGWGGNISLGQFGIVGIGAMAAGNLLTRWNLDLFVVAARRHGRRRASSRC